SGARLVRRAAACQSHDGDRRGVSKRAALRPAAGRRLHGCCRGERVPAAGRVARLSSARISVRRTNLMNGPRLIFDRVSKQFARGERHDSLRDLIPAVFKRGLRGRADADDQTFWALKDVSFEVREGEALGIIGQNGAGKSTVLKLLNRIMKPTEGSCAIVGRAGALIELAAGFHPDLTGRENVYLHGAIMGMRRAEISARFDEIVTFAGIDRFIDTPVKRYSSGMNARLGFSIAAHVNPDVLLIDEVLAVGDMTFQARCQERMKRFRTEG